MHASILKAFSAGTLIVLCISCGRSGNPVTNVQLAVFQKQMEQVDASVSLGMSYSQVVASIGRPFVTATNQRGLIAIYHFDPPAKFYQDITNGLEVEFANGLVVRKSPLTGSLTGPSK